MHRHSRRKAATGRYLTRTRKDGEDSKEERDEGKDDEEVDGGEDDDGSDDEGSEEEE